MLKAPLQRYVRIDLRRLDHLMSLVGELLIVRGRLAQRATALGDPALEEAVADASRLIGEVQDGVLGGRMVPVWQVFDRFPRVVRDAAHTLGKEVEFVVEGREIELDRVAPRAGRRPARAPAAQCGRPRDRDAGGAPGRGKARRWAAAGQRRARAQRGGHQGGRRRARGRPGAGPQARRRTRGWSTRNASRSRTRRSCA